MFVEVYHVQQGLTLLFFFQRYPGGFKQLTAAQLHHKDPTAVSVINQYYFKKNHYLERNLTYSTTTYLSPWIFITLFKPHSWRLVQFLCLPQCRCLLTFIPSFRRAARAYKCEAQRTGINSTGFMLVMVVFGAS